MSRWLTVAMVVLMAAMGAYIIADVATVDRAESQNGIKITLPAQTQTPAQTVAPTIDDLQKRIVTLEQQVAGLQRQIDDMKKVKILPAR